MVKAGRADLDGLDTTRVNDLSVEEIKACPIFGHLTDDQALEVIQTLKKLAEIAFDTYHFKQKKF